jgi:ABC-type multidrug transport system ATPase subunit
MQLDFRGIALVLVLDLVLISLFLLHQLVWKPRVLQLRRSLTEAAGGRISPEGDSVTPSLGQEIRQVCCACCSPRSTPPTILNDEDDDVLGKGRPLLASATAHPLSRSLEEGVARRVLVEGFVSVNRGVTVDLEFEDLQWRLKEQTILHSVSGSIRSHRVTAIMGPSGAGKTSFLNVLLGKYSKSGGSLRVNGEAAENMAAFKKLLGFVPQDDTLLPELTVRESILFSARSRLPREGWGDDRIQRHVDAVIDVLGLTHVADSLVGDVSKRGISGGQRKRTNIGLELAVCPCVLLLDEPSSGLDSSSAFEVCQTLRVIADLGVNVIAVIHQPRVEIFELFDDILLLEPGGRVSFMGPQECIQEYFESQLGLVVKSGHNPADDILDLISQAKTRRLSGEEDWTGGRSSWVWKERGAYWVTSRRSLSTSSVVRLTKDRLDAISRGRGASFCTQLRLFLSRSMLQQYRLVPGFALEIFVAVLAGASMGASIGELPELYRGVLKYPFTAISPSPLPTVIPSLGMYIAMAIGVSGSPAGVQTFNEEREVYFREASRGSNRLAYFLAKNIAAIPRIVADALHFTSLFVVLAHPFTSFEQLVVLVLFEYLAVYGLSSATGMVVARANSALLAVIVAVIVAILCGFGPSLKQGERWGIGWLQSTSFARWGNELFYSLETAHYRDLFMVEFSANYWGYTLDREWLDLGLMGAIAIAYRLLAFVLMVSVNRRRQL